MHHDDESHFQPKMLRNNRNGNRRSKSTYGSTRIENTGWKRSVFLGKIPGVALIAGIAGFTYSKYKTSEDKHVTLTDTTMGSILPRLYSRAFGAGKNLRPFGL